VCAAGRRRSSRSPHEALAECGVGAQREAISGPALPAFRKRSMRATHP
jgi:hypothetical protein